MIPVLPPGCSRPRGHESASCFEGCLVILILGFVFGIGLHALVYLAITL